MHAASTQRCALAVAEPTGDASKQRRAPAAAEAPKRWCPAGANPIVTSQNRSGTELPCFPVTIKGFNDTSLPSISIGVRSGSVINMVSESVADECGLEVVIDDFGYDDYLDPDQTFPIHQSSVVGLTCFTVVHSGLELWFDGFVVSDDVMDTMHADVLAGAPFMEQNDISIRPSRHQIRFGDECVYSYHVSSMPECVNVGADEKVTARTYEREHETLCDNSKTECELDDYVVVLPVMAPRRNESEYEDPVSELHDMCVDNCVDYDRRMDSDIPITEWSSTSPNTCVRYDDGCCAIPATEHEHDHSSGSPVAERCSSHSSSDNHIDIPVTMVTEHSSCLVISETVSISCSSVTEPSSGTPTATEPCSVILINAVADVPQVPFRVSGHIPGIPNDHPTCRPCKVESSDIISCSPVLSTCTTSPPAGTPMGLRLPQPDEGVLPLQNQCTLYAALPHRRTGYLSDDQPDVNVHAPTPSCHVSGQAVSNVMQHDLAVDNDRLPACLHQPPPVWTNWPTADCDPLSAMVEYRPHSNVNHPNDCAALPRLASGHKIVCDVDDPPQATLADDDVPCLRPPSTDVGRHASPTWKSPPWTDGRLPPASSMERGPSPRPHDGAMSAFAHVMATKRVSPAPARGIAPLGSFDVSHPFGVPWTLPPAPPDVGLTAVPHGHNPPESPFTPG